MAKITKLIRMVIKVRKPNKNEDRAYLRRANSQSETGLLRILLGMQALSHQPRLRAAGESFDLNLVTGYLSSLGRPGSYIPNNKEVRQSSSFLTTTFTYHEKEKELNPFSPTKTAGFLLLFSFKWLLKTLGQLTLLPRSLFEHSTADARPSSLLGRAWDR